MILRKLTFGEHTSDCEKTDTMFLTLTDPHHEINNRGMLQVKLYDIRDDFTFPIVSFPFICSNIPASPAYGIYISLPIRYSRAWAHYNNLLDRGQLLTQKTTPRRACCSCMQVEVITTKILRSSSWTGWPLRNIFWSVFHVLLQFNVSDDLFCYKHCLSGK